MKVRKAGMEDLDELVRIYENAKVWMHNNGNPNQWHQGHPNRQDLQEDIENAVLYVLVEDGIQACFSFVIGEDPTYGYIEGSWLNEKEYAAVHRVVSAGRKAGMGQEILNICKTWYPNLKIDTHQDNLAMQKVLEKNGFTRVGIIYLENGDPRLAYQYCAD